MIVVSNLVVMDSPSLKRQRPAEGNGQKAEDDGRQSDEAEKFWRL